MTDRYDSFPKCSGCGSIAKRRKSNPTPQVRALYKDGVIPWDCPLPECDAPAKCHGQIGIGVATLGTCCGYPEGHDGEHSYGGRRCNKHIREGVDCP